MSDGAVPSSAIYVVLAGALLYSTLLSLGLIAYIAYKPRKNNARHCNLRYEVVIVSKASKNVEKSLFESIKYHTEKFGSVTLVVDEEAELLPKLKELHGVKLVVVPSSYRRDLAGKGRALQYFTECCVDPSKWYVLLDDDSLVLDDDFLYEIPAYEGDGYVAANGVLVPRPGRSLFAYVMDWARYFEDLFFYRFFTGVLSKPLLGLHGDLLLVKGSVLREIGFNNHSLAEDFDFAAELVKRNYKTWQSRTRVSIRSPNSLGDLAKQRGRWFRGVIQGLKRCPFKMKLVVVVKSFGFVVNILAYTLAIPLIIYAGSTWLLLLLAPGALYSVSTYIYGARRAGKPYLFLLAPLFGILEVASRIYGLIYVKDYVVIDKN